MLYFLRLPLFIIGLVLLFCADRYLGGESYHFLIRLSAMLMSTLGALFTFVLVLKSRKSGSKQEGNSWFLCLLWMLMVLCGVVVYLFYDQSMAGAPVPSTWGLKLLLGTWSVLICLGIFLGIGLEWGRLQNGSGDFTETARVRASGLAWLCVGMLLTRTGRCELLRVC